MSSIGLVTLVVHDYDEAIAFYVGALGFILVEDTPQPEQAKRWVVVSPPGAAETRLLLARASNAEQASRVGNQTGGRVALFLVTDDLARDHAAFVSRGVVFVREPAQQPYGAVAVFRDPWGNLWDLLQPAATPAASGDGPGAGTVTSGSVAADARLKLFGSRGSGSAAIEMALRAARVGYDTVRASTWEPDSARDELRRLNPLGQIPTLVLLDGTVLTESAAILISLGLQYPQARLLPVDPAAQALAIRGLVFIAANGYSAVSVSDYPQRWTTARSAAAREQVRAAARANLHRTWEIFADTFGADALLMPNGQPGALAFLAVVVSRWSGTRKHLREARPAFFDRLLRLEQHPLVAPVLREHA